MRIQQILLTVISRDVLRTQSSRFPVMRSNDTYRTLKHHNEQVAVKLKRVDSQLHSDQCLLLKLGKDKPHGHTGTGNNDPPVGFEFLFYLEDFIGRSIYMMM